jgi:hypothetical protein
MSRNSLVWRSLPSGRIIIIIIVIIVIIIVLSVGELEKEGARFMKCRSSPTLKLTKTSYDCDGMF